MKIHALVWLCTFSAACAASDTDNPVGEFDDDKTSPIVEIEAPARGTMVDGMSVIVSGRATDEDSGVDTVVINGVEAPVAGDGSFEATIELSPGLTLLQTTATDRGGNEGSDTRSVLAGTLATAKTPVENGIVAHVNSDTLSVLGNIVSDLANATNFTAIAQSANPVVDSGGSCLGAEVDVVSVSLGEISMDTSTREGGIAFTVRIPNVHVDLDVDFDIACIGGSAGSTLTADMFTATGFLPIGIDAESRLSVDLQEMTGVFQGFELDVGFVPSSVVSFFVNDVDEKVAAILIGAVDDMVPSMAQAYLSDFSAAEIKANLGGNEVVVQITPSAIDFTDTGGTIALDTNSFITGVAGGHYITTPSPMPNTDIMPGQGLKLGIADDAANQLLASLWASGALDRTLSEADGVDFGALGSAVSSVNMTAPLPPVITADDSGNLSVTVGDLGVEMLGPDNAVVSSYTLSGHLPIEFEINTDGALSFATGDADVVLTILEDTGVLAPNLLEGATLIALKSFGNKIDSLLKTMPIPSFGGAQIVSPSFESRAGYMLVGAGLSVE